MTASSSNGTSREYPYAAVSSNGSSYEAERQDPKARRPRHSTPLLWTSWKQLEVFQPNFQEMPIGGLKSSQRRLRTVPNRYTSLPMEDQLLGTISTISNLSQITSRSGKKPFTWRLVRKFRQFCTGTEFVFDPRTTLMQIWDVLIWTLAIVCSVVVPFKVAFFEDEHLIASGTQKRISRSVDTLFYLDMLIQLFTMYYDQSTLRWIRSPRAIVMRYLKGLFVLDMIANFPIDILAHYDPSALNDHKFRVLLLLRLVRLTRFLRMRLIFMSFRMRFGITSASMKIPGFLLICAYFTHLLACAWALTGRIQFRTGNASWLDLLGDGRGNMIRYDDAFRVYIRSLYWAVGTLTSIGYGDIVPQSQQEYAVCIVCMALAGFVWAYAIGTICGIIGTLDVRNCEFELMMDNLEGMLGEIELDSTVTWQLRRFYERQRDCVQMRKDLNLLRMMSPGLHARIAREQVGTWLEHVPYMKDIAESSQVVMYIRSEVDNQLFSKRDVIELPQALCLLRRGLALKGADILCQGAVWGDGDVLLSKPELLDPETPISLTYSEVLHLPQRALYVLEERHSQARKRIRRARARYAVYRYFVNIGRQLKRSDTDTTDDISLYYTSQHDASVQVKLSRLQHSYALMHQRLDGAFDSLKELQKSLLRMRTSTTTRNDSVFETQTEQTPSSGMPFEAIRTRVSRWTGRVFKPEEWLGSAASRSSPSESSKHLTDSEESECKSTSESEAADAMATPDELDGLCTSRDLEDTWEIEEQAKRNIPSLDLHPDITEQVGLSLRNPPSRPPGDVSSTPGIVTPSDMHSTPAIISSSISGTSPSRLPSDMRSRPPSRKPSDIRSMPPSRLLSGVNMDLNISHGSSRRSNRSNARSRPPSSMRSSSASRVPSIEGSTTTSGTHAKVPVNHQIGYGMILGYDATDLMSCSSQELLELSLSQDGKRSPQFERQTTVGTERGKLIRSLSSRYGTPAG